MRAFTWMILAGVILGSMGCVAQQEFDNMQALYRQSEVQKLELQAQLEETNERIRALQNADPDPKLQADLAAAEAERDRLQKLLDEAEAQLRTLPTLPEKLTEALEKLAAANPQLMSYDASLGMVRMHSDLTFALGSTKVSASATSALSSLARVLNTSEARPYEIRIVGHTDNVPVKNPANKQKYGDNWGLSAFRAIAVKDVLQKAGVTPARMNISGYGEYRPIGPNGPHGAEANRRVEIYLVEMTTPAAKVTPPPTTVAPIESDDFVGQPTPTPTPPPADEPAMYK